ncbi:hypothetical protein N752_23650 [Desulforamulus aquiferis]|nr:hypothetical protein N752_23650 [Desulforamulus aquiferis]
MDNLDHAIEVAKKTQQRLRLVTLSGELFHPGGSLSGGGLNKSTGGMLHTRREKDGLVRVVQDLQGKVQRATLIMQRSRECSKPWKRNCKLFVRVQLTLA